MKNTYGTSVKITIFGESHGAGIGAVLDGLAPGIPVDEEFIASQLSLRRPVGQISTPRVEKDNFIIYSGVFEGYTTGTPICIVIPNENTKSKDYSEIRSKARPYSGYTLLCFKQFTKSTIPCLFKIYLFISIIYTYYLFRLLVNGTN